MSTTKYRWLIGLLVVAIIAVVIVFALLFALRPTVVPDVTLKPIAAATSLVEEAGLVLGAPGQLATTSAGSGLVAEQSPAPSSRVARRSSVEVTVAVTPVSSPVPDVVGRDVTEADRVLTDALYLPLAVDVFDTETPRGVVLDQVPSAGTSWMTGRPVAMGVAAGPDDGTGVTVPDLGGKTIDAAMTTLGKAGLGGRGFVVNISSPQANVIVDQLPEGGVVVRPGTTVLLLFRTP